MIGVRGVAIFFGITAALLVVLWVIYVFNEKPVEVIDLKDESSVLEMSLIKSETEQIHKTGNIIIFEVIPGTESNPNYESIKLLNTEEFSVSLEGWQVKKVASTGTESTLVSSRRLKNRVIQPEGYLILASSGYNGSVAPDIVWPKSYTLASNKNTVRLYNATGEKVSEFSW